MSPPDPRQIVLACAADDGYVQPLAVMFQSAIANLDLTLTLGAVASMASRGAERVRRADEYGLFTLRYAALPPP
jgi:hypothetical protein